MLSPTLFQSVVFWSQVLKASIFATTVRIGASRAVHDQHWEKGGWSL